jgi:hypothetical protein
MSKLLPPDTTTITERIVSTENIISSRICLENGAKVNCSTSEAVRGLTPSQG